MTADNTIKGLRKYMYGTVFQLRLMPCYYATKNNVFTHTQTHTRMHTVRRTRAHSNTHAHRAHRHKRTARKIDIQKDKKQKYTHTERHMQKDTKTETTNGKGDTVRHIKTDGQTQCDCR